MKNKLKTQKKVIVVFSFLLFFSIKPVSAQYYPFYSSERNIKDHSYYESFQELIDLYNQGEDFIEIINRMDSIAQKSINESDGVQYLFFKNEIANLYRQKSMFPEAFDVLQHSMEVFTEDYDSIHMEYVTSLRLFRTTLNSLLSRPGGFEYSGRSVMELFQDQFSVMEELGDTGEPLRNTLVDYGLALAREGKTDEAIQIHHRARTLALEADDLASLALADYSIMANVKTTHDMLETQTEVLKNDIDLFESKPRSIPVQFYTAFFLTKVSQNYFHNLNNTKQAIYYAEKAAALLDTLRFPAHNIKAATHGNLALYYSESADTNKVWSHVAQARDVLATQPMSHYNRAFAYVLIADAAVPISTDSVFTYLSIIDTLQGKTFFKDKLIEVEAKTHMKNGLYAQVTELVLSAFEEYEYVGELKVPSISPSIEYINQFYFLNLLEQAYRKKEVENESDYSPAIVALIMQQNDIFHEILTEDVFGFEPTSLALIYNEFLDSALPYMFAPERKEFVDEKIQLAFSSKSMHLNNLIAKKRFQSLLESDTDLFSKLLKSSAEVQNSRNRLAGSNHSDADELYMKRMELNSSLIDYFMLKYEINNTYFDDVIATFQENIQIANLHDIQALLEKDEALIEYFLFDNSWAQIVVLPDTVVSFYYPETDIRQNINRERHAILTGRQPTDLGNVLFKDIAPILEHINKLVIIPDKDLSLVPFESMKREGKMLIENFSVSYSYSATLWHKLRKESEQKKPQRMLTIAPLFLESYDKEMLALTSNYRGDEALDALPFSLEEIKGIGSIMKSNLTEILHLYAENASFYNVKKHIGSYDIVHFATHGVANPQHPERSGLFLYQERNEGETKKSGFLSLGELYNMNLNTELVVLSSCNTGRGRLMQGEGVIALPRGFILAGVPRVVATLWKVHDERTKDIMLLYYNYLANGYDYREALRLTKLEAINKGFLPMDWAGFVLIGS